MFAVRSAVLPPQTFQAKLLVMFIMRDKTFQQRSDRHRNHERATTNLRVCKL